MRRLLLVCGILLVAAIPASAQDSYPSAEVFGGYSFLSAGGFGDRASAHGVGFSVAGNLGKQFGIVGDFSYHRKTFDDVGFDVKANITTFLFGPRLSVRGKSATGFVHVLVGGARLGGNAFGISDSTTGVALGLGGGVDINAGKSIAIRIAQLDYIPARFEGEWFHSVRYEAGIVIKFGGK